MNDSSEILWERRDEREWRCLACSALHYLARRASQGNYCPRLFIISLASHEPSERLLRKCTVRRLGCW